MYIPQNRYTEAQKAHCLIWFSQGYGATAIRKEFFTKYRVPTPSRRTIHVWAKDYRVCGTHSHRGGNGRPFITEEKRKNNEEVFHANAISSLQELASVVGIHHTTLWRSLCKKLEMFPYLLQIGQLLDADKPNRIALLIFANRTWKRTRTS